jgi:hypothetical protein
MTRLGHGVSTGSVRTLGPVRRGASFEAWLRDRGVAADVAAEWAGHAVWVTGYAAGRWGKVLFDVTPTELEELAAGGWVDWEQVGPAVGAWFDWLRGEDLVPRQSGGLRHPSVVPHLRLVEGGSP